MDAEGLEALEAAADCVARARYVVALTGAGLSVESGIPPFRGPDGLWTKHGEPPMNGFQRFLADPRRAWEERLNPTGPMRELWEALGGGEAESGAPRARGARGPRGAARADHAERRQPAPAGRQPAPARDPRQRHADPLPRMRRRASARDAIDFSILPPRCPRCGGLLKSDTVSFGEPIPPDVLEGCFEEAARADCMIVAGTSATVYPAAQFPLDVHERGGDLIEVNPYPSELTAVSRYTLQGPGRRGAPRAARSWSAHRR